jgi:monoamine oxidase
MDAVAFDSAVWKTPRGGMELLISSLMEQLAASKLKTNRYVRGVKQDKEGKLHVSWHDTEEYDRTDVRQEVTEFDSVFDAVILTVPLGVVRGMNLDGITQEKERAIRRLEYDHSCKVYALFKKCWWKKEDSGLDGATSVTDLPIRKVVYPNTEASPEDYLCQLHMGQGR